MPRFRFLFGVCLLFVLVSRLAPRVARADTFLYVDENGAKVTLEARLLGSGQGVHVLEQADGQLLILPQAAVQERTPGEGPTPLTGPEMAGRLEERFGQDKVRSAVQDPFVVALVLAAPLDRAGETRAGAFVKKAARFMKNVDTVFSGFCRDMRLPLDKPRYPLVLVIFEADSDFNAYAEDITNGRGLSVSSMAGFYAPSTNWLAVRMTACDTFEVPLHEAIHQHMYNRGLFQRLAPIPAWFNEGIATGFESSGDRIDVHPAKVNSRYARQAKAVGDQVSWEDVVREDAAFRGDVLVGDAYTHAWSMHWMLVTQHKDQYRAYVQELAAREPLEPQDEDERLAHFEQTFGVAVAELHRDFPRVLEAAIRRQRTNLNEKQTPAGVSLSQEALGEVQMTAVRRVDQGGQLHVQGQLRNISPLRAMTYYVTVETETGVYADWLVPDVTSGRTLPLKPQVAVKLMANAPGGPSGTFRVRVKSAPADSREAAAWKQGQPPSPTFADQGL